MKALTLWQPWASLVAMGEKRIETRCWSTSYRGELAIHAAARRPKGLGESQFHSDFQRELSDVLRCLTRGVPRVVDRLPRGSVLCIVKLVSIEETSRVREILCERELLFGNYEDGRFAWNLQMVERFDQPIAAKGNRMLWNWRRDGK